MVRRCIFLLQLLLVLALPALAVPADTLFENAGKSPETYRALLQAAAEMPQATAPQREAKLHRMADLFLQTYYLHPRFRLFNPYRQQFIQLAHGTRNRYYASLSWMLYSTLVPPGPQQQQEREVRFQKAAQVLGSDSSLQAAPWHMVLQVYSVLLYKDDLPAITRGILNALQWAEKCHAWPYLASFYSELGLIYGQAGNRVAVIDYYKKAILAAELGATYDLRAMATGNLASVHEYNNKLDSARLLYEQCLDWARSVNDLKVWGRSHASIADIYNWQGKSQLALQHVTKALALLPKDSASPELSLLKAYNYLTRATALSNLGQHQQALGAINEANFWRAHVNDLRYDIEYSMIAAKVNEAAGRFDQALKLTKLNHALNDSLQRPDLVRQREELVHDYEKKTRDLQLASLRREEEAKAQELARQRTYLIIAIVVACCMGAMFVWVFRINKNLSAARIQLEQNNQTISQQYEQVQALAHTKDKLFSIIAHDLRGPLAGFKMLPDIIEMAVKSRETDLLLEMAQETKQTSNSLHHLLERLLTWAQSQSGSLAFLPAPIPAGTLLQRQQALYREAAKAKAIDITIEAEAGLQVYTDPDAIETAVRNLVNNAVKFTQPGGSIWLRARAEKGQAILEVADNGPGMDAQTQARLFQAGGAGSTQGTAGERGVGLGMMLIKDLVQHCRGTITVSSQPGRGTCFTIVLAKVVEEPMGQAAAQPALASERLG